VVGSRRYSLHPGDDKDPPQHACWRSWPLVFANSGLSASTPHEKAARLWWSSERLKFDIEPCPAPRFTKCALGFCTAGLQPSCRGLRICGCSSALTNASRSRTVESTLHLLIARTAAFVGTLDHEVRDRSPFETGCIFDSAFCSD